MNRFRVTGVPGLKQAYQVAALQIFGHAEFADTRNAGTDPRELCQRFATAALDVAADLQGKLRTVTGEGPVGFGSPEVEAKAVVTKQILGFLRDAVALQVSGRSDDHLAGVPSLRAVRLPYERINNGSSATCTPDIPAYVVQRRHNGQRSNDDRERHRRDVAKVFKSAGTCHTADEKAQCQYDQ